MLNSDDSPTGWTPPIYHDFNTGLHVVRASMQDRTI